MKIWQNDVKLGPAIESRPEPSFHFTRRVVSPQVLAKLAATVESLKDSDPALQLLANNEAAAELVKWLFAGIQLDGPPPSRELVRNAIRTLGVPKCHIAFLPALTSEDVSAERTSSSYHGRLIVLMRGGEEVAKLRLSNSWDLLLDVRRPVRNDSISGGFEEGEQVA